MRQSPGWREIYEGGSPEAERAIFQAMAAEMLGLQGASPDRLRRMMYAKTVAGVTDALLLVDPTLPPELAVGHFRPGAGLPVTLRFSNASAAPQVDNAPDMRGLALRLSLPKGHVHDLVMANFPTSLARDGRQFHAFAMTAIGDRETLLARLAARLGIPESRRIALSLKASLKLCSSLARERFWSGCAFLWGEAPVRFELRPMDPGREPAGGPFRSDDALRLELAARLAEADVLYRLAIQRYVDERLTPIEDAARDWNARLAPAVEIATLVIPRQDILSVSGRRALTLVDKMALSPWNAPAPFRPLGSLNRMRRVAYEASAQARRSAGGT